MRIQTDYQGGILTLCFCGELDHNAAAPVMRACEEAIEDFIPRLCMLDFSELLFMDSSGIAVILKTEAIMRQIGGDVEIINANEQTSRVLRLSNLERMIKVMPRARKECETI